MDWLRDDKEEQPDRGREASPEPFQRPAPRTLIHLFDNSQSGSQLKIRRRNRSNVTFISGPCYGSAVVIPMVLLAGVWYFLPLGEALGCFSAATAATFFIFRGQGFRIEVGPSGITVRKTFFGIPAAFRRYPLATEYWVPTRSDWEGDVTGEGDGVGIAFDRNLCVRPRTNCEKLCDALDWALAWYKGGSGHK